MARTGIATLPLHHGRAPRWLFQRMVALAREIALMAVGELGRAEFLKRLSDPFWFQALGCVLGFDWHSSGVTTTVTGALKEGIKGMEGPLGLFIAGGKGAASRKAPAQIEHFAERCGVGPEPLVHASRMSAKVDSAAVQDGYQLYHHVFFFTSEGQWAVVQQGMNVDTRTARRYHWLGEKVQELTVEPHSAVCCDKSGETLNLVAKESASARTTCAYLARENPDLLINELSRPEHLDMPMRHRVRLSDIESKRLHRILLSTYEQQPAHFESLLGIPGVGPKTVRALSLLSELLYGAAPSYRDPARFGFAHGGKDGTPYPVDVATYDRTIDVMKRAVNAAKIGNRDKTEALRRLGAYFDFGLPTPSPSEGRGQRSGWPNEGVTRL